MTGKTEVERGRERQRGRGEREKARERCGVLRIGVDGQTWSNFSFSFHSTTVTDITSEVWGDLQQNDVDFPDINRLFS